MMMRIPASAFACLLLLASSACDAPAGPPEPGPRVPASISAAGATDLSGIVGMAAADSVRVRVLDADGSPLGGVPVVFRVLTGGGSISPAVAHTRPDGTAAVQWLLGTTAGVQAAEAAVATLPPLLFAARAAADVAAVVTVHPDAVTLTAGDTTRLSAAARDRYGNDVEPAGVQWSTSDAGVATVDTTGLVIARQPGDASITARIQQASASLQISVRADWRPSVATVTVTPDSLRLAAGDTVTLQATVRDSAGAVIGGAAVVWSSSDAAVATVDASGRVVGRAAGSAIMTATSEGRSGTALLHVVHPAATAGVLPRLAAGQEHSCALDTAGAAFCWGANWGGQLGDGTTRDPALSPVRVSGGHAFIALAAGSAHTCGLKTDGSLHCWGNNAYGQLGIGTTASAAVPVRVPAPDARRFVAVAAGDYHTCAITDDGTAYCWGSQLAGELGVGAVAPAQCVTDYAVLPCSTRPMAVAGGLTWRRVTAGHLYTCGIATDDRAYCWGMNSAGNLGTGDVSVRNAPAAVAGGRSFAAISAGAFHTCAISSTGQALCWGLAQQGQLGIGSHTPGMCPAAAGPVPCATAPVLVASDGDWRQLDSAFYHTCAVTRAGRLFCWGLNNGGQLAVPDSGPESCPAAAGDLACSRVPVGGAPATAFNEVSAGGYHTLGRDSTGALAWGSNWYGQLGTGGTQASALPLRIAF
jgi:alpha-tubulin suppressor-like RCC1 family protein